jgi:hypothetical protein
MDHRLNPRVHVPNRPHKMAYDIMKLWKSCNVNPPSVIVHDVIQWWVVRGHWGCFDLLMIAGTSFQELSWKSVKKSCHENLQYVSFRGHHKEFSWQTVSLNSHNEKLPFEFFSRYCAVYMLKRSNGECLFSIPGRLEVCCDDGVG